MIKLSIGDICIQIEGKDNSLLEDLRNKYKNFLASETTSVSFQLFLTHPPSLTDQDEIFVTKNDDIYTIDGGEFQGSLDLSCAKADIELRAEKSVFDSFLRVFYSIILPYHQGFLVHSAGVATKEKGYLFAGPSESGKTTTAKMAGDLRVLNDELTMVRSIDDEFYLFSTPFTGDYSDEIESRKVLLDKIFFLNKNLGSPYEALDSLQTAISLFENIFFFDSDISSNEIILELVRRLTERREGYQINILARENLGRFINEINEACCHA